MAQMQYHTNTPKPAQTNGKAPCSCEEPTSSPTCCELVCPERPRYFCGHLLTDDDLASEQRYVIEKQKLYHRSLHGHGVVCGLRLTCHGDCSGHIRIGKGYAIDDCGHDLIACAPMSFNVVERLREKGLLLETKMPDPCEPKKKEPECKIRQCFPIVICYREEEAEFVTPFTAGCRPQLSDCEATRVRETVYFDVLAELPKTSTWIEQIQERIQECIALFTKGPFAQALEDGADIIATLSSKAAASSPAEMRPLPVRPVVKGETPPTTVATPKGRYDYKDYWDLFCKLKKLLLLYLSKHPDKYHCTLPDEIRQITMPTWQDGDYRATESNEGAREAFCQLLGLAYQHVTSCILGEVIFDCPEPCKASCVVLGTVEVDEQGRVIRVCNCPRTYVLSFASLLQSITAQLLGGGACDEDKERTGYSKAEITSMPRHPTDERDRRHCCREFDFDCVEFMRDLITNQQQLFSNSTAFFEALSALGESVRHAFDFTGADFIPRGIFTGMTLKEATAVAKVKNINLTMEQLSPQPQTPDPIATVRDSLLPRKAQPMVAYHTGGRIIAARPAPMLAALDPADRKSLQVEIDKANARAEAAEKKADQFGERLEELIKKSGHERAPDPAGGGGGTVGQPHTKPSRRPNGGSTKPENPK